MKGSEIRQLFLDYFQEKGHAKIQSSSLVPVDDPTLLFTNAGMVQFKATFLGNEKRPYKTATSSQKCVRAGGKHNDLENVGRTARHHTFFEMLGNFSFGDYFKQGAIEYAWDLLVHRMGLDQDRLWVSVHHSDDEAYNIWRDVVGVRSDRIVRLGDKDNFWAMGDTGPCGPCSEILFDQGPTVGCGRDECRIGECDCDRYLEIWNLVFMQFDRASDGTLTPLPAPNIDTGMGLERITAIIQGVKSNYETDLFMPLINYISNISGVTYNHDRELDVSIRVIADHARACAFLAGDGVLPSNEGRGYVLRRIIRRAARHGKLLGMDDPFLNRVAMQVIGQMGDIYPDLNNRQEFIQKVVLNEEERFLKTLDKGLSVLDDIMAGIMAKGGDTLPGDDVFMLYDTFGFPVDITEDIAGKKGLKIDNEGFSIQMDQQRRKARESSGFAGAVVVKDAFIAPSGDEEVRFVGYDMFEVKAKVLGLYAQDPDGTTRPVDELKCGDQGFVITDKTPFYGESGGQIGDTGMIRAGGICAEVVDTIKNEAGLILHKARITSGAVKKDQDVELIVDMNRRKSIMRHHSATHLLQKALQEVLGDHAHQSGSLVTEKRLRFDFTHFKAMDETETARVEAVVNQYVVENLPIKAEIVEKEKALEKGAMALFTEKYGEEVRMVSIGGDVSIELCGGTHCGSTGEIGLVKIISESSVSAGLRRIEAVAGTQSLEQFRHLADIVSSCAQSLKCAPGEVIDRITSLQSRIKEQDHAMRDLKLQLAAGAGSAGDEETFEVNSHKVIIKKVEDADVSQIRVLGDRIKDKMGSGVVFLYSAALNKATYMIMVTKDLEKVFDAGRIMKVVADSVGGRGGGKALFAQGGSPDASSVDKAVETFRQSIRGG